MTQARYAFVKARWHADIVDRALDGFLELIPAAQVDVDVAAVEFARAEVEQAADLEHLAVAVGRLHAEAVAQHRAEVAREVQPHQRVAGLQPQHALLELVIEAHHAHVARKLGAHQRDRARGIALDRQVTVILSQTEGERPLCGIYFNLSSPYHRQRTSKLPKTREEA